MSRQDALPVAVIGAGPVGLAAAAHLLERELEPLILEAGAEPAAAVGSWGHVRVFSPWRYNIDAAAERILAHEGWSVPELDAYPTGDELRRDYLLPLAGTTALRERIRTDARVVAVTRLHRDKMKNAGRDSAPFEILVDTPNGRERLLARAVIDASGALDTPNPLGASGIAAEGEAELAESISYGLPNIRAAGKRFAGKRVLVVGSGHSAMNALQDLAALKRDDPATTVAWAVRRATGGDLFGGEASDGLAERGKLGSSSRGLVEEGVVRLVTGVEIDALERREGGIVLRHRGGTIGPVDEIIAATGFRPDLDPLRELRLALDPSVEAPIAIAPLIDPNFHSCGSVPPHGAAELAHPEADFYIAGLKSYGRAPTFLMLTGYEQVRSIAAALAGDLEAAARVELVLPETGVCKISSKADAGEGSGCCGAEAPTLALASVVQVAASTSSSCCS